MFTEYMTFEEIRREFEKDKIFLQKRIVSHSEKILKLMRQTNMSTFDKYFEYLSPLKNRWTYRVMAPEPRREKTSVHQFCTMHTSDGYAVILYILEKDQLIYFTSHFFTRFYEREHLPLDNPGFLIRTYLEGNDKIASHPNKEIQPGIWTVYGQSKRGMALGYLHHKLGIFEFRTFINNEMLRGNQVEISKQMEEKFKLHVVRKSPGEK